MAENAVWRKENKIENGSIEQSKYEETNPFHFFFIDVE
jgi:hypothetical protein